MKHILISILLCLGVFFSPAYAQDSFLLERAQAGDAEAQFELGVRYYYGDGVPEDEEEAAKWTRLAAEQGHAGAQNNLGLMYFYGEGVRQDREKAVYWYCKAAEQGHKDVTFNLFLLLQSGACEQ